MPGSGTVLTLGSGKTETVGRTVGLGIGNCGVDCGDRCAAGLAAPRERDPARPTPGATRENYHYSGHIRVLCSTRRAAFKLLP